MDIRKKRKLFSLIGLFKLKLSLKSAPGLRGDRNEDGSPDDKVACTSANADEWPLHVDGYYDYTKFHNEGFYN